MPKPPDSQENFSLCICGKCPVFAVCNKEKTEKLFCAKKKSDCEMDAKKMCICGMCKVFADNKLTGGYFCKKVITSWFFKKNMIIILFGKPLVFWVGIITFLVFALQIYLGMMMVRARPELLKYHRLNAIILCLIVVIHAFLGLMLYL